MVSGRRLFRLPPEYFTLCIYAQFQQFLLGERVEKRECQTLGQKYVESMCAYRSKVQNIP